jgi:cyclase
VRIRGGRQSTGLDPAEFASAMQRKGAGEILLNAIDRDGTQKGYDVELIRSVTSRVSIPVIACGGAGKVEHFVSAVKDGGASAAAAGSMFVFHGKHRAVLISYPNRVDIEKALL